jgi:hypothetical protein
MRRKVEFDRTETLAANGGTRVLKKGSQFVLKRELSLLLLPRAPEVYISG